ncbi:MAG: hypothetical protein QOI04_1793 [Verrucomicrobiota bacterium]|jgi:hypothetical protein
MKSCAVRGRRAAKIDIYSSGLFFLAVTFLFTIGATAQEPGEEDHVREELGVNHYTTPSIANIFHQLDELKPLPFEQLQRPFPTPGHAGREQMGVIFGGLVADGFLIVACERKNLVDDLGRVLLREARSLGVEDRVMRHSASLTELAKSGDWATVREELTATQNDVEQAMIGLRDEKMAHLISLGGWLRGLEIAAGAVETKYTPLRAKVLLQPELANYFAEEMKTLPPAVAHVPLFEKLRAGIEALRAKIDNPPAKGFGLAEAKAIRAQTRELNLSLRATE